MGLLQGPGPGAHGICGPTGLDHAIFWGSGIKQLDKNQNVKHAICRSLLVILQSKILYHNVIVESSCELAKASNETGCVTTAKNADFQPKSWHFLNMVEDRYTVTM